MGDFPSTKDQFSKTKQPKGVGRPKGTLSITDAIIRNLKEVTGATPADRKRNLDKLVDAIIKGAIEKKDIRLMETIWKMIDGAPKASVDVKLPQTLIDLIKHAQSDEEPDQEISDEDIQ